MEWIITAGIGILGGFASGLLGLGGGIIFVPLLIMLRGFDPHLAIGTSLLIIIPTALVGAMAHAKDSMVDWKAALLIAVFAIIGSWLGAVLSLNLDGVILRKVFAVFLVFMAVKIFFQH